MTRTFTGSALAFVLIAIIAVKHLALGFCLCQDELYVNECACECAAAEAQVPACCDDEECPVEEPCNDCMVAISLDTGDFLWNADSFQSAAPSETALAPAETPFVSNLHTADVASLGAPVGGSPPGGPPVFLRTTVLRL